MEEEGDDPAVDSSFMAITPSVSILHGADPRRVYSSVDHGQF
jgi:hypothetical protein